MTRRSLAWVVPAAVVLVAAVIAAAPGPVAGGSATTFASSSPIAVDEVRFGTRPGRVRVVLEFRGAGLQLGEVELRSRLSRLFSKGRAKLLVRHAGVATDVPDASGRGVGVRLDRRGANRLRIRLQARKHRFKYLEELVLDGPDRLVLDLWKAKPPTGDANVTSDGCLRLGRIVTVPGSFDARGRTLQQLFENALVLIVRNARGRTKGEEPVVAADRRWRGTVGYRVRRDQRGTLEAAVFSAKDGSLECLVQLGADLVAPAAPIMP